MLKKFVATLAVIAMFTPAISSAQVFKINQLISPITAGFVYSTGVGTSTQSASTSPWFLAGIHFSNATGTQATTTSLFSTGATFTTICFTGDTCRTTWPSGGAGLPYPFPLTGNATSTLTGFNGGLFSLASSTLQAFTFTTATGTSATTTSFFSTTASTTNLFGTLINGFGLSTCTGTNALTWTGGSFTCTAQPQGTVTAIGITTANGVSGSSSGGATPNLTITLGAITPSSVVSSGLGHFGNLWSDASSTLQNFTGLNSTTTNATTTTIYASGNITANNFIDSSTGGNTCIGETGTLFDNTHCVSSIASSGSTLTVSSPTGNVNLDFNLGHSNFWTVGQMITASTTIGGGTSSTGLTVNGQATTTNLLVTASSTLQNFTATNSTSTNATTTGAFSVGTTFVATGGLSTLSNLLVTGSSTLQNFTGLNSTTTNATTTSIISTTASTTNSFVGGKLGIGTSSPATALTVANNQSILVDENKVATSTSQTINWSQGNQQLMQIGTSAITVTMTSYLRGQHILVLVCNPGSGTAGAITWSGVEWAGGTKPTQTTTANQCDAWSFLATQATSTANTLKIFGTASTGFQ